MSLFKSKCHEANHFCDKGQYKESTFCEKVKLNIHLLYCRACRKYSARNGKLTKVLNNPKVSSISEQDKQALKKQLHDELSK